MTDKPTLLLVDDDPTVIQIMGSVLDSIATVRFATSGADALRLAHESNPDLVLLDIELGDMTGLEVMAQLKTDVVLKDVPIIFVTSNDDEQMEVDVFEQGAVDFITKPIRTAPLMARVQTQLKVRYLTQELRRIAKLDALTGLANRRAFDELFNLNWRISRRTGQPLSLLMIDVDQFKRYNDHYGHQAGDVCLKAVADHMGGMSLRPGDLVARYGGEEFVMLLPDTSGDGALYLAQRLLEGVRDLQIEHVDSTVGPHVTVSIGLACTEALDPQVLPAQFLQSADNALYAAKNGGRGRVCVA